MSTNWCSGAAAASMASSSSKWAIPLAARVRIGPGEIALARICLGPSSAAPRRCNPPRGHADRPRARKQSHAAGSPVGPTLLGSSRMQPPVGLGLAHRRAASTCSRASWSQGGHMAAPCRSGRLPRECRPPATKARAQPAAMTPSSRVTTPADLGVIDRVELIVMDAGIRRRLASNSLPPASIRGIKYQVGSGRVASHYRRGDTCWCWSPAPHSAPDGVPSLPLSVSWGSIRRPVSPTIIEC